MPLWNPAWITVVMAVYAMAANAPFIVIQRFNRARVGLAARAAAHPTRRLGRPPGEPARDSRRGLRADGAGRRGRPSGGDAPFRLALAWQPPPWPAWRVRSERPLPGGVRRAHRRGDGLGQQARRPRVLAAGAGVSAYGLLYALVHDVCVHGRLSGGRPLLPGRWLRGWRPPTPCTTAGAGRPTGSWSRSCRPGTATRWRPCGAPGPWPAWRTRRSRWPRCGRGCRCRATRAVRMQRADAAAAGRCPRRPTRYRVAGPVDLEAHQLDPRRRHLARPTGRRRSARGPPAAGRPGPGRGPRRRRAGSS